MKGSRVRSVVKILATLFLLYTNLLMGQFLRTTSAVDGLSIWAIIKSIFTPHNFVIGLVGAVIGFLLVESVNRR